MTAIQEVKDLNSVCLETLTSSLKSLEMGLLEDGPSKKRKSFDLKSKSKLVKAIQVIKYEEDTSNDEIVEGSDEDEVAFLAK